MYARRFRAVPALLATLLAASCGGAAADLLPDLDQAVPQAVSLRAAGSRALLVFASAVAGRATGVDPRRAGAGRVAGRAPAVPAAREGGRRASAPSRYRDGVPCAPGRRWKGRRLLACTLLVLALGSAACEGAPDLTKLKPVQETPIGPVSRPPDPGSPAGPAETRPPPAVPPAA